MEHGTPGPSTAEMSPPIGSPERVELDDLDAFHEGVRELTARLRAGDAPATGATDTAVDTSTDVLGEYADYYNLRADSPDTTSGDTDGSRTETTPAASGSPERTEATAERPAVVTIDEDTITLTGMQRARRALRLRAKRLKGQPDEAKQRWDAVAADPKSKYDRKKGVYPRSRREWSASRSAFRRRDDIGTLRAELREDQNGVYEIDERTGKSTWRDENGSLDHVPRKTRKAIEATERRYADRYHRMLDGERELGFTREATMPARVELVIEDPRTPHHELYGRNMAAETPGTRPYMLTQRAQRVAGLPRDEQRAAVKAVQEMDQAELDTRTRRAAQYFGMTPRQVGEMMSKDPSVLVAVAQFEGNPAHLPPVEVSERGPETTQGPELITRPKYVEGVRNWARTTADNMERDGTIPEGMTKADLGVELVRDALAHQLGMTREALDTELDEGFTTNGLEDAIRKFDALYHPNRQRAPRADSDEPPAGRDRNLREQVGDAGRLARQRMTDHATATRAAHQEGLEGRNLGRTERVVGRVARGAGRTTRRAINHARATRTAYGEGTEGRNLGRLERAVGRTAETTGRGVGRVRRYARTRIDEYNARQARNRRGVV